MKLAGRQGGAVSSTVHGLGVSCDSIVSVVAIIIKVMTTQMEEPLIPVGGVACRAGM